MPANQGITNSLKKLVVKKKDSFIEYLDMLLLACEIKHNQDKESYYQSFYEVTEDQYFFVISLLDQIRDCDEVKQLYMNRLNQGNRYDVSDLIDELIQLQKDQDENPSKQFNRYYEINQFINPIHWESLKSEINKSNHESKENFTRRPSSHIFF